MTLRWHSRIRLRSLHGRLLLLFGFCLVVTVVALAGYGFLSKGVAERAIVENSARVTTESLRQQLAGRAEGVALQVEAQLGHALAVARSVAATIGSLRDQAGRSTLPRAEVISILRAQLLANPGFVGVYTGWEPNAFDGRDAAFALTRGHDASGRFVPYVSRSELGPIGLEPLADYASRERFDNGVRRGEYYLRPMETREECAIDPYPYKVQGKSIWMTSLVAPIAGPAGPLGIAGVDIRLDEIEALAQRVNAELYDGSGAVAVVTGAGTVVTVSGRHDLAGRRLGAWRADDGDLLARIARGASSVELGDAEVTALAPVRIGASATPWGVVVVADRARALAPVTRLVADLERTGRRMLLSQVLVGVLVTLCGLLTVVVFSRTISAPIRAVTAFASKVAGGDLGAEVPPAAASRLRGTEETEELGGAIGRMTDGLRGLIGQVQRSGIQVTASATEIAGSARHLEGTVTEQAASTAEVTAATREILATAQELSRTMEDVAEVAGRTAALAGESRAGLEGMGAVMRELEGGTGSVSGRLAAISERTRGISGIVTTITKVADQTNLLSLNASIEAEKAGEHGRGFAVVAREIRRLADQTAVATLDIERMVEGMHAAVGSGVMEMDRFVEQVRRGAREVGRIGEQLGGIVEQVQCLKPRFEQVREGMASQRVGAEQITGALVQLTEAAVRTKESLVDFSRASEQLDEAVAGLRTEVARFRVEG